MVVIPRYIGGFGIAQNVSSPDIVLQKVRKVLRARYFCEYIGEEFILLAENLHSLYTMKNSSGKIHAHF